MKVWIPCYGCTTIGPVVRLGELASRWRYFRRLAMIRYLKLIGFDITIGFKSIYKFANIFEGFYVFISTKTFDYFLLKRSKTFNLISY